ncbi:MAG: radical SAM protein [Thermoleophilia bacterium]|nr:radical SAM protein [Thermoleophilia bacterium]
MSAYLSLDDRVSLRRLEEPCLYDRVADELYELDEGAWAFLLRVDGVTEGLDREADPDFLKVLLEEGLARLTGGPIPCRPVVGSQSSPSLRYLELYLTQRCNLRCGHCFLGRAGTTDLPEEIALRMLDDFDALGGLRLLLTGGEALLHPAFRRIDSALEGRGFRSVLLSNGTLLEDVAAGLHVQEVQVSLDGLRPAHDALRGPGAFDRALRGLRAAAVAGLDVSVATTVNALDRDDFPELEQLVRGLGARAWHVDVPSECGSLAGRADLLLPPWQAAGYLDYAFGGGTHDAVPGAVCGSHLMAVFADGVGAKCGFYHDEPLGRVDEGLDVLWGRVPRPGVESLACGCEYVEECHGGCRFRALTYNGVAGPDPVQCCRYGVLGSPPMEEVSGEDP